MLLLKNTEKNPKKIQVLFSNKKQWKKTCTAGFVKTTQPYLTAEAATVNNKIDIEKILGNDFEITKGKSEYIFIYVCVWI